MSGRHPDDCSCSEYDSDSSSAGSYASSSSSYHSPAPAQTQPTPNLSDLEPIYEDWLMSDKTAAVPPTSATASLNSDVVQALLNALKAGSSQAPQEVDIGAADGAKSPGKPKSKSARPGGASSAATSTTSTTAATTPPSTQIGRVKKTGSSQKRQQALRRLTKQHQTFNENFQAFLESCNNSTD